MTNEKSILVPRRLLEGIKEYMEWGKSRVDPRPLSEWMDEVLAKPDEPTPGRCPTCSRWLEMRCAVCGPVESSDEPKTLRAIPGSELVEALKRADEAAQAEVIEWMRTFAVNRAGER